MHTPIAQADLDQYRAMFELNVVRVLNAMQSVIPIMRTQGGGMIINDNDPATQVYRKQGCTRCTAVAVWSILDTQHST